MDFPPLKKFSVSSSEIDLELLRIKKKIEKIEFAVRLIFAFIVLLVLISIALHLLQSDKSENDNNELKFQIRSLNESNLEIEKRIRADEDENEKLKLEVRSLNESDLEIQKIVRGNQDENNKLKLEIGSLNESNLEIEKRIRANKDDNEKLKLKVRSLNESDLEIQKIVRGNQDENNELKLEVNALTRNNLDIRKRIHVLESQLSSDRNQIFRLEQSGNCLDVKKNPIELHTCHDNGGNQEWQFTVYSELKNRNSCVSFTNKTSKSIIVDQCNGSANQKWKFVSGNLQNTIYDKCVQVVAKDNIIAAKCNSSSTSQTFKWKLLYKIDRFCTFKQGNYVLLNIHQMAVADNGFLLNNASCVSYNKSWLEFKVCSPTSTFQKWEYTEHDGKIRNIFDNVCVEKLDGGTVAVKKCKSDSESQKWICDKE